MNYTQEEKKCQNCGSIKCFCYEGEKKEKLIKCSKCGISCFPKFDGDCLNPYSPKQKDWQTQYPLNTFTGETKKELIDFISKLLAQHK